VRVGLTTRRERGGRERGSIGGGRDKGEEGGGER
jgi:hypothetical protein